MGHTDDREALLTSTVRVPEDVVYREFAAETVVLNLTTGRYHGLNATAAAMLRELERAPRVSQAVESIAAEFDAPVGRVEADVLELCATMVDRGLIVVGSPAQ